MTPRRLGAPLVLALTVVLATSPLLSACSGSAAGPAGGSTGGSAGGPTGGPGARGHGSGKPSRTVRATSSLPVPDGPVLTDPGSELGLGEEALVAWRPQEGKGSGEVGLLKMTVRRFQRVPITALDQWQLDRQGRASSLYYVTVSLANMGKKDVGGSRIPLYVLADDNTLVRSNPFTTTYEPCPSVALPASFPPHEKTTACLVYLLPGRGELEAASFRPNPAFNPITWVGKVTEPEKPTKKGAKANR